MGNELFDQAKAAKSAEELQSIAKENGVELSDQEAAEYFAQMHKAGELSDEELDHVSGGGCHKKDGRLVVSMGYHCDQWTCVHCGRSNIFNSDVNGQIHYCPNGDMVRNPRSCATCKFKSVEKGLWICNHPENTK